MKMGELMEGWVDKRVGSKEGGLMGRGLMEKGGLMGGWFEGRVG